MAVDARTHAIDVAMEIFQREGYEHASIAAIVEEAGLNRYALYREFGGKRELFMAAVKRFHTLSMMDMEARLAAPGVKAMDALEAYFMGPVKEACATPGDSAGSLICQASFEVAPKDEGVAAMLAETLGEKRGAIRAAMARARTEGDLREDLTPDQATAMVLCMMFGLGAQAHSGFVDDGMVEQNITTTFALMRRGAITP